MLADALTNRAQSAARILSDLVKSGQLNEHFLYWAIGDDGDHSIVEISNLGENFSNIDPEIVFKFIPPIIDELHSVGLIRITEKSREGTKIAVLPFLHKAVDANFKIHSLGSKSFSPSELADLMIERLMPFLSQEMAFNSLQLAEIREGIEELRRATDQAQLKTTSQRIWERIGRTGDVVGLILALTSVIK